MSDTIRDILTANKLDKIDFAEAEQAINEYIAQQTKEARIDELDRLLRPFLNKRVYGVNAELTINAHNRIVGLRKELTK